MSGIELYPENRKQRNEVWDTLVDLFGQPSPNRRSLYGRVTKYLSEQQATPDEIRRRVAALIDLWGLRAVTITSLEAHWSRFDGMIGQMTSRQAEAEVARLERQAERQRMTQRLRAEGYE